ncbi:MAG: hypothetical protein V8T00_00015 [Oscillospiraceae bacterium]
MINKALEYLQREYLHNLDMIEGLRRDLYDVLYAAEDGVLICDREGGRTHMLSCRDAEAALRIAKLTQPGCGLFVAHQADTVARGSCLALTKRPSARRRHILVILRCLSEILR